MPQGSSAVRPTNGLYLYLFTYIFCLVILYQCRFNIELGEKFMETTIGKLLRKGPVCKDKLKMKNKCIKIMKNRLFLSS
jgi:hypothetical protein